MEYAARAVAVAARAEARRVQLEPGPALEEVRRQFRAGPLAALGRTARHAKTMASIADLNISSNRDADDRWDAVAARLGAVAARLRMIRCQRQLKAQQTLRDDLSATSKRAQLARKRLKPLAEAVAKRASGGVTLPPCKSLWRMSQLAGLGGASLDAEPYEAPMSEDGGETDATPEVTHIMRGPKTTLADLARDARGFRLCSLPDVAKARVTVATPSQFARAILALEEADVASVVEGSDAARNRVELVDCVDCLFGDHATPGTVFFHFRFVDDDAPATAFVCELQLCLGQLVTDDWRAGAAFDGYRSARELLVATGRGDLVDAVEREERKRAAASAAPAPAPQEAPAPRSIFRLSRGSRDDFPRRRRSSVLNAVAAALGRRAPSGPTQRTPMTATSSRPRRPRHDPVSCCNITVLVRPLGRARHHPFVVPLLNSLPLVLLGLAPAEREVHLQQVLVVEVERERDQGEARVDHLPAELADLALVEEEAARPSRLVLEVPGRRLVRRNIYIYEHARAALDAPEAVGDVRVAVSAALDLRALERDAGLHRPDDLVGEARLPVGRDLQPAAVALLGGGFALLRVQASPSWVRVRRDEGCGE